MKNKVVLFHGRASSFGKRVKIAPLALLHLSSFLVRDGFEVKIISDSLYDDDYIEETLKQCEDSVCLGITAMTGSQITEGLKVASLVRQRYPGLPIVWGGWHPSIMPESTLQDPNVDIVIAGQGERKFYELVKRLGDGGLNSLETMPGVSFKKNGQVVLNDEFLIEDMNSFPPVPYDIIDVEKCLNKTEYGNRTLQYISSYGCPFRCSFCIEPVVNRRKWVSLSAERVVDEWEYLYKRYSIDAIAVYDSNFFVDKKRVVDICNGLIKRNIKIKWGNVNGRIPQLVKYEEGVWELMEKAGLKMILTGSESGEQEVLNLIKKDAKIEDIYRFTELCKKYNIKILFSYMSGIPWSNDPKHNEQKVNQEIKSILSQIDKLLTITNKNRFMIYAYTPLPGSELYRKAVEYGFNEPKALRGWSELLYSPEDIFQDTGCKQKWITYKQLKLITMLEQYIYGMMDLDARDWIMQDINNIFFRLLFKWSFNLGNLIVRIRLKYRIFIFPVDYWLFVKFRKLIRI
ncbi:MAG: radical SAM protein [Nitrospirae bacterium]|nr:radical SAM protein [Nitrospirota bacterium]